MEAFGAFRGKFGAHASDNETLSDALLQADADVPAAKVVQRGGSAEAMEACGMIGGDEVA